MTNNKKILGFSDLEINNSQIAATLGCSRTTVIAVQKKPQRKVNGTKSVHSYKYRACKTLLPSVEVIRAKRIRIMKRATPEASLSSLKPRQALGLLLNIDLSSIKNKSNFNVLCSGIYVNVQPQRRHCPMSPL